MVVGRIRQETLYPCFVLLVILRELVLPDGFDPVSPSFRVRDVATELSGLNYLKAPVPLRLQLHLADECQVARNPDPWFPVDYLQPPSSLFPY
ncbi:unnamed protein product [Schistosoma curassoni]|uniref:Uncharacterized protein n=1 Tax=Schistosoma curassoni TaxID=6186 RepID=A0A183JZ58_9TREM|nr:unnamed protein product [Schistosoma curassoni]